MGGFSEPARSSRRFLVLVVLGALLSGCAHWLEPGAYRLKAQSDEAPTAYRNILDAAEKLTVAIKLANLSERALYMAPDRQSGKELPAGLFIRARLLTPNPYIVNPDAVVLAGLSGGRTLQDAADDHKLPFIDRHQRAVDKLAEAGPPLLNINADDVKTGFRLLGNEAMALLLFDVAWDKVETDRLVVETPLEIELSFYYRNPDQNVLRFERTIQYRVMAYLVNAQRGFRSFIPVGDPEEGEFRPTEP